MNHPIKVGIIGIKGLPAQAGVDRVVEAVVKRLPALGFDITVYCDSSVTPDDYALDNIRILRVGSLPGKYLSAPSRFLNSAISAIFYEDFDLIHLHNVEAGFILPLLRLKYPVISTAHGFAYWRSKWGSLARWLIKLANWPFVNFSSMVTSVSEKDAKTLSSKYGKNVVYIPNGVEDDFQPNMEKAEQFLSSRGLSMNNYFIFVAGRIEPTKGAHLAISAVNQLEEKFPLLVVGDLDQVPAYRKELEQMAGQKIRFIPLIKDTGLLFGLIAASRCLIFPSTVEAMSMVLLEAASLGVPIVASDIPENKSVLGEDAEYFVSGNTDSLIDRLKRGLENEQTAKTKGREIQQRIRQEYNWNAIVVRYVALYKNLITEEI